MKRLFEEGDRVTLIDGRGYYPGGEDVGKSGTVIYSGDFLVTVKLDEDGRAVSCFHKRWKKADTDYRIDQEPLDDEETL